MIKAYRGYNACIMVESCDSLVSIGDRHIPCDSCVRIDKMTNLYDFESNVDVCVGLREIRYSEMCRIINGKEVSYLCKDHMVLAQCYWIPVGRNRLAIEIKTIYFRTDFGLHLDYICVQDDYLSTSMVIADDVINKINNKCIDGGVKDIQCTIMMGEDAIRVLPTNIFNVGIYLTTIDYKPIETWHKLYTNKSRIRGFKSFIDLKEYLSISTNRALMSDDSEYLSYLD